MGTIVTSGVGSGLDVASLVKQLVEAEGAPKSLQLDKQEAKAQSKLSALGSLRSALATFRSAVGKLKSLEKFQGRQATLSSENFVLAAAGATAAPGTYSLAVEQLASAHKLQSAGFASTSAVVGTGTLTITVGGQIHTVDIGAESQTLAGIAAAINDSSASAKVIATVISGASDARLTISGRDSGEAGAITITQTGGDGGLAAVAFPPSGAGMTELQAALDSRVRIDGVLATSATNSISGAIAGVDLTLKAVNEPGETTKLDVSFDRASARAAIDTFITGYNGLVDALRTLTSYNAETRQGAPLFGDGAVRNIIDQLRRELTGSFVGTGPRNSLASIGITAQLDGKLAVDAADLDAAFSEDFDAIGSLFAEDGKGVAVKLDTLLESYLSTGGAIESRTVGLKSTIDSITDRREVLAERLAALQVRYTKQFNALDGLLSQLQGTSNFLNQQLSQLPGSAPLTRSRN